MSNKAMKTMSFLIAMTVWILPGTLIAASIPKATMEILKELKLDPGVLAGVDEELQVPNEWIERARKEGKLIVRSTPITPPEVKTLFGPFNERYPFISVDNSGANQEDRSIKTLVAYRSGRVLSDVVTSVGGFIDEYKKVKALEDLRQLPGWKNVPDKAKDPQGFWAGNAIHYWCMTYNTKRVKKEELPKKWEDFLANPRWKGGTLAMGNRPQLWAVHLWAAKGEAWTKDFMTKLMTEVKPQIRKEGMGALVALAAAGEFDAVFPSNARRVYQNAEKGAPVSFHCPEPAPADVEDTIVLRGSPNPYAAKLFVNWLLSKEGQIVDYAAKAYTPVHKNLDTKAFFPFPEAIAGKQTSFGDPAFEQQVTPKVYDFWNGLLAKGGKG
jgi:iron(III) transport system substrate-binding protein